MSFPDAPGLDGPSAKSATCAICEETYDLVSMTTGPVHVPDPFICPACEEVGIDIESA